MAPGLKWVDQHLAVNCWHDIRHVNTSLKWIISFVFNFTGNEFHCGYVFAVYGGGRRFLVTFSFLLHFL